MRVVVLTGAGISAESGLATFRGADGLWEGHRPEDVATPEAFAADRELVQRFYDERRARLAGVEPNPAHRALARLEEHLGDDLLVVTQNIDDLHERAGTSRLVHMHGELRRARCESCGARPDWQDPLVDEPPCPMCGVPALRPDVVWFGEEPYEVPAILAALDRCELFVAIGTSGLVYPAAGFVSHARARGARTVLLNLEATASGLFTEDRHGPAATLVPAWVDEILGVDRAS